MKTSRTCKYSPSLGIETFPCWVWGLWNGQGFSARQSQRIPGELFPLGTVLVSPGKHRECSEGRGQCWDPTPTLDLGQRERLELGIPWAGLGWDPASPVWDHRRHCRARAVGCPGFMGVQEQEPEPSLWVSRLAEAVTRGLDHETDEERPRDKNPWGFREGGG